jgi:diaminohydroxyphosphoribosylaminopyrimidine deaminase/5-amino-6-(5-phosphoribosylamino)uracil reductase
MFFYAPKLVGGEGLGPFAGKGPEFMADSFTLKNITINKIGDDILVQGYPENSCLQV